MAAIFPSGYGPDIPSCSTQNRLSQIFFSIESTDILTWLKYGLIQMFLYILYF